MRTELQRDADGLDCTLYRVISGVESLYSKAESQRNRELMATLRNALIGLRSARGEIRSLMSEEDRKVTS
jgi:hypothetical protein